MESAAQSNIRNIAFEVIKTPYSWGLYGEFKVIINTTSGYINATNLCAQALTKNGNQKEFRNWIKIEASKELIEALSSSGGIPPELLTTINMEGEYITRGTYVHPDLIPHIASWCSPKFAIAISKIVNEYFTIMAMKELNKTITEQKNTIAEQIKQLAIQSIEHNKQVTEQAVKHHEELIACIKDGKQEVHEINDKLDMVCDRFVPHNPLRKQDTLFAVFHRPNSYDYKVIRCQAASYARSSQTCKNNGYTTRILRLDNVNPVNIYNRIKDQLPVSIGCVTSYNSITLQSNQEAAFKQFILNVDLEKTKAAD